MRTYAIKLLTSPDVMCKYNLINPQTITNIVAIYVYYHDYVHYNQKLFVSHIFQAPLS